MEYIIQNIELIDIRSPHNRKRISLRIQSGIIQEISDENIPVQASDSTVQFISGDHLKLSVGWFDMRSLFPDPGFEYKETLTTGSQAAMQGGFTGVALLPNCNPVIQNKNSIAYLEAHNAQSLVHLYPIAAASLDTQGEIPTEMIDLHEAGAIAFSDGKNPIQHSDVLLRSLQYLQIFDGLLINRPEDERLSLRGVMNEGINSTLLGLKGRPKLAEEMMIQRDIRLLKYAGGRLHFSLISGAQSVDLIREAKAEGLAITCDVAAHQLVFDDSVLHHLDSDYKVNPPFRTREDVEALWQGLEDGTIDVIVSDHQPQDTESKNVEFDLAEFGLIGLETLFPVVHTYSQRRANFSLEQLVDKITYQPREILKIQQPTIQEGSPANLTLFDSNISWEFGYKDIGSKSKNTPFINHTFQGKAIATFNKNKFYQHQHESKNN